MFSSCSYKKYKNKDNLNLNMKGKRGQGFLENILLWGVITVALIGLLYISMGLVSLNYKVSQANDVVTNLAITADAVYNLGLQSKDTIRVNVPAGVKTVSVNGKEISLELDIEGKPIKVSSNTKADVVGSIPMISGRYSIPVKLIDNGIVKIGDGGWMFYLNPNCAIFSSLPLTVEIIGDDFTPNSQIIIDGNINNPYPSTFVTYYNPTRITFSAVPGFFPADPMGTDYTIQIYNPTTEWISNPLIFIIYKAGIPANC